MVRLGAGFTFPAIDMDLLKVLDGQHFVVPSVDTITIKIYVTTILNAR